MRLLIAIFLLVNLSACSSQIEEDFIRSCMAGGAPESACECMYGEFIEEYGIETVEDMRSGKVPQGYEMFMMKAAGACR